MLHITGGSNITISNLTFDGGSSGGNGILFAAVFIENNSGNIHVESNKYRNNFNQSDIYVYNSDAVYFRGNIVGPNEYQPVSAHLTDSAVHNGIYITDNQLSGFTRMGV